MSAGDLTATNPPLSRERVVEAAVELAEEQGLQAVSLRQVARRLGVTPMALYWHVENKDDLLDAMVGWLHNQMEFTVVDGAPWQAQLRAVIEAEIEVLRAYPQTALLILSRGATSHGALAQVEVSLGILRRAGFSPEDAAKVLTYLQTIVSLVAREALLAPTTDDGAWQRRAREAVRELPSEDFPNITAAANYLTSGADPDAYYRFGLDLLIAGIEALAPSNPRG
ncbi:MAG TPA: TetR/AcrR family transcriptional regulator C-terminal domain-containing protein [Thermomicrobiales bacterium]|nr:TetR/AcrR family transcriptional regulator C-terminal domain-containing protein [Thermomicrobiales bacterium]